MWMQINSERKTYVVDSGSVIMKLTVFFLVFFYIKHILEIKFNKHNMLAHHQTKVVMMGNITSNDKNAICGHTSAC